MAQRHICKYTLCCIWLIGKSLGTISVESDKNSDGVRSNLLIKHLWAGLILAG